MPLNKLGKIRGIPEKSKELKTILEKCWKNFMALEEISRQHWKTLGNIPTILPPFWTKKNTFILECYQISILVGISQFLQCCHYQHNQKSNFRRHTTFAPPFGPILDWNWYPCFDLSKNLWLAPCINQKYTCNTRENCSLFIIVNPNTPTTIFFLLYHDCTSSLHKKYIEIISFSRWMCWVNPQFVFSTLPYMQNENCNSKFDQPP